MKVQIELRPIATPGQVSLNQQYICTSFITYLKALYEGLIGWSLTPSLAVFQLYLGVNKFYHYELKEAIYPIELIFYKI